MYKKQVAAGSETWLREQLRRLVEKWEDEAPRYAGARPNALDHEKMAVMSRCVRELLGLIGVHQVSETNPGRCKSCNHSLENNKHGFDQNDVYNDKSGKLVHSGTCTYCQECNPGLREMLRSNQPSHQQGEAMSETKLENKNSETEQKFLSELTALSQKYRLGITGDAVLFLMEWDDSERVYVCDGESRLSFR